MIKSFRSACWVCFAWEKQIPPSKIPPSPPLTRGEPRVRITPLSKGEPCLTPLLKEAPRRTPLSTGADATQSRGGILLGGILLKAILLLALALLPPTLQAQQKRLSDWLLEQPATAMANAYPLGLSWRVPGEAGGQYGVQLELLKSLSGEDRAMKADAEARKRLREWLAQLPATGRVPVALADARWLQGNPLRDPILQPGHSVVLPTRPTTVTVVTARGTRCLAAHAPGREAMAYVSACSPAASKRADWAWVAQPDGRVQRFGVATWNRTVQDEPAPGAWIWAPPRDGGWPEPFSERLVVFLATQGPAPDLNTGLPAPRVQATSSAGATEFTTLPAPPASAARSQGVRLTAGDWGSVGVLQTPSARMEKAGHLGFTMSRTAPYTHGNLFVQPFDWLETGFRYTDVSNRLYGPDIAGEQSYKDKSIDFKLRLFEETARLPQLALGIRDMTGTGLFSGEYVVANKRTGAFDWSVGLGWGNMGGRGNLRNPMRLLGRSEVARQVDGTGQTGQFSFGNYFSGPAALFGGVQYQTPWERLILKLEYDGNDYQHEPQGNNQVVKSPWNFGAVYRLGSAADLNIGVERGNTVMLGLTLRTDLPNLSMRKLNDAPRLPVADARPVRMPDWAVTGRDIKAQSDWHVARIDQQGRDLRVTVDDAEAFYWRERADRTASVLHRDAPATVDRFTLAYRERGIEVAEHVIDRDAWVAQQTQTLPPHEQRAPLIQREAQRGRAHGETLYETQRPAFEHGLGFNFQRNLGGPDGFVLFQAGVVGQAKLRLRDDTWLQGSLQLGLVDNYNKFKYTAPSNLPRVRTFLREYVTSSSLTMPNLQATHVGRLGGNHYYSVYGGYLESMFAGAGAEWLYRPFGSRVAIGADVNAVQQRDFNQDFALRDYKVATGHATLYWDTGWNNVEARVSVGRYLAGDIGGTVEASRTFENGVRVGAFFTRTNVSAAQFGEGSFDKGLYISLPFDAFLTKSSGTVGSFVYKPLTRDGGAILSRSVMLYDVTRSRDDRRLRYQSAPLPNDDLIPADRREAWSPAPMGPAPFTQAVPRAMASQWAGGVVSQANGGASSAASRYEQRLIEALYRQGFRNIEAKLDVSQRISITASNEQIRPLSRAVGRAARTALNLGPLDSREIRVTFIEGAGPAAVYDFVDLRRLARVFGGELGIEAIADSIAVEYPNPSARQSNALDRLTDLDTPSSEKQITDVLLPDVRTVSRVIDDVSRVAGVAASTNWMRAAALGTGLVMISSKLDKRIDRFAADHAQNRGVKGGIKVGNAIPWVALGGSALLALDNSDPVRSRTAFAAVEAGGAAILAATGLKYAVGRGRPGVGADNTSFKPFSSTVGYDAFPSRHVITAWAVATPFAEEYNAPWLYGVAALTNLSRIGSREHWFSDTVGASLLGWGIGKLFYESSREPVKGNMPRVSVSPNGVQLGWVLQ